MLQPQSKSGPDAAPRTDPRCQAMTLVEVMVALLIMGMFASSAVSLALFNQIKTQEIFIRLEAYRLAQTIAEHAMEVPFTSFTVAGVEANDTTTSETQWTWSNTETAMLRTSMLGSTSVQGAYQTRGTGVTFTKTITDYGSTVDNAKVLKIQISWTFAGQSPSPIYIYVVRGA